ncbi:hypothetical protein VT84_09365 [Gemmata sp. SH-PL17]|uniref:hypothetical protein n=1 Tax=Gemmata sp. SH-PL17 TaxID=1630693 RepID=UPI00078E7327|nr:hypothetical protein [Gemmata sp. SH-PL17]AMV24592.1 hypothetical protein VT84_09365 [Gemmata sp. SH-PL17]
MPLPVYTLLARGLLEDTSTKLVTAYNLVEMIDIHKISEETNQPDGTKVIRWNPLFIISAWMIDLKNNETEKDRFIQEIFFEIPDTDSPLGFTKLDLISSDFKFAPQNGMLINRTTVQLDSPIPFAGPGIMWVASRIKRDGTEEWTTQKYPVVVRERIQKETDAPAG